jgi:hypothetical protein
VTLIGNRQRSADEVRVLLDDWLAFRNGNNVSRRTELNPDCSILNSVSDWRYRPAINGAVWDRHGCR